MRRYPSFRHEHTSRVATRWLARRLWVVVPHMAIQFAMLAAGGLSRARLAAIAALHLTHAVTLNYWNVSLRRGADAGTVAHRSNLIVLGLHALLASLTGGLPGPLTPSIIGVVAGSIIAFGRSPRTWATLAFTSALVVVMGLAGELLPDPMLARPWLTALSVEAVAFSLFMLSTIALGLTEAYEDAGESLDAARIELLDDALSRARALEGVGARVAHELKNPLAAIKALVELASSTTREDKRAERLRMASAEIERMESILRAWLSFERPLESAHVAAADLAALASEAVALLDDRAAVAGVTLRFHGDEPVRVKVDARLIRSAVVDVTSNAIEASSRGGTVTVTVRDDGEHALVEVRDEGRGMSPDTLARVGTAYFTTRAEGSGLGVVLARQAVTLHGGALSFESELGRGTRVTLSLPRGGDA